MARMYKQLTQHVKDDAGSSGSWSKIAYFKKDTPRRDGTGFLDKVKVNFLVDDIDGTSDMRNMPYGHLFALSSKSVLESVDGEANQLHPERLFDITAREGGAGVATLYANCKIQENQEDLLEGDGLVYLWEKRTDISDNDDITMRYYIETYGRWVECVDA